MAMDLVGTIRRILFLHTVGIPLIFSSLRLEAQTTNHASTNVVSWWSWSEIGRENPQVTARQLHARLGSQFDDPAALQAFGEILYRSHQYPLALCAFQRALAREPKAVDDWYHIGSCCYEMEQYGQAAAYRKYIAQTTATGSAHYWLYESLSRQHDYKQALPAIVQAAKLDPANSEYEKEEGFCLMRLHRDADAIKPLNQALASEPKSVKLLYLRGFAYYRLHRYSDAIGSFTNVLALNPTNASVSYYLGICYYNLESYARAQAALQRYADQNPSDFDGHYWLGRSLDNLGRHDDAVKALQQAVRLKPNDFYANLGCGVNLVEAGRYPESFAYFETAHKIRPGDWSMKEAVLVSYLLSAQYHRAYDFSPGTFIAGGGVLLLAYAAGLTILLRLTFSAEPKAFPGIWFSLAWGLVFFEGQIAAIGVLGLLSAANINQGPVAGIILTGVPIIIVAIKGFSRQPWGEPFVWPPQLGNTKLKWMALAGLGLGVAMDASYSSLYERILHHPLPVQETTPFVQYSLKASPVTAALAIVIVAPVVEEILFRGLLYGAFSKWMPPWGVIAMSSALFAIVHLQPVYLPPIFCMGLILGWLRWKSESVALPALVHGLNNGLSLILLAINGSSS